MIELIYELWRPIFAFHVAERDEITPTEASREIFGWNVFSEFSFGPSEEDSVTGEKPTSRLDAVLRSVLDLKYDVRNIRRAVRVHKFAEEKDMTPEEASIELYDENILSQTSGTTEDDEK